MLRRLAIAAVALSAMIGQPAYAARPAPSAIPAQRLPIDYGIGLNNRGQVLGRGGVWQHVVATDLGTLGGANSRALAINDRGEVVGVSNTADGPDAFFVWRNGVLTGLPVPGQVDMVLSFPSTAGSVDLNNRGQVVFTGTKSNGHDQAYRWQGGVSTSLGDIGGPYPQSTAYAVNERGEVTGTINGPAGARAYRWRFGVFTVLDVLPGDDLSESFGINDQGLAMGLSAPEIDGDHAVIWR